MEGRNSLSREISMLKNSEAYAAARREVDEWYLFKDLIKDAVGQATDYRYAVDVRGWVGSSPHTTDLTGYHRNTYLVDLRGLDWGKNCGIRHICIKIHDGKIQVRSRDNKFSYWEISLADPDMHIKLTETLCRIRYQEVHEVFYRLRQEVM